MPYGQLRLTPEVRLEVQRRLLMLRDRHGSWEGVAQVLRVFEEFRTIDRTTVWKWWKRPTKSAVHALVLLGRMEKKLPPAAPEISDLWLGLLERLRLQLAGCRRTLKTLPARFREKRPARISLEVRQNLDTKAKKTALAEVVIPLKQ